MAETYTGFGYIDSTKYITIPNVGERSISFYGHINGYYDYSNKQYRVAFEDDIYLQQSDDVEDFDSMPRNSKSVYYAIYDNNSDPWEGDAPTYYYYMTSFSANDGPKSGYPGYIDVNGGSATIPQDEYRRYSNHYLLFRFTPDQSVDDGIVFSNDDGLNNRMLFGVGNFAIASPKATLSVAQSELQAGGKVNLSWTMYDDIEYHDVYVYSLTRYSHTEPKQSYVGGGPGTNTTLISSSSNSTATTYEDTLPSDYNNLYVRYNLTVSNGYETRDVSSNWYQVKAGCNTHVISNGVIVPAKNIATIQNGAITSMNGMLHPVSNGIIV